MLHFAEPTVSSHVRLRRSLSAPEGRAFWTEAGRPVKRFMPCCCFADTGAEETLARIMGMKSARDTSQQQSSERKKHQKR